MKDFSKYQGIFPAFYACYDEEGNLVVTNRYDKDLQPVEIP